MKLLYGTGNLAKLELMRRTLAGLHVKEGQFAEPKLPTGAGHVTGLGQSVENFIEILGLEDMEKKAPEIVEAGKSPQENARQKALAYYEFYQMPVFSCDSGLYFEGLPDEVQPGVHVRTIHGKYLTDEEMVEYYTGLARKYGDLKARYHNGICLVMDKTHIYECMDESLMSPAFIITAMPYSKVRHKGFPIDSISIDIASGKYFYELGEEKMIYPTVEQGWREFFRKCLGDEIRESGN